jgi:hypothetical protein
MSLGDLPSEPEKRFPAGNRSVSRRRAGSARIEVPFTVEPQDERRGYRSLLQRFRDDAKSFGMGLTASLVVHAILMALLALIVFQTRQSVDGDPIEMSWSVPKTALEVEKKPRRNLAIPIEVASIPNREAIEKKATTDSSIGQVPTRIGVAPVKVDGALADRNPRLRSTNESQSRSQEAERSVKAGLGWLARQQTGDGHWELHQGYPDAGQNYIKTDTGATALSLLCFLGHGETHLAGEHQEKIAKGLKWLQSIQDQTTGDLHDQRQEEGRNGAFYAHSMGTIALCEALAMTGDDQLRPSAELAVKYLIDSQHPDMGGWKYRPLTQRVMSGDLSVTAWALMALHSARIAGIAVSDESFERSSSFLDRVQEQGGARYKYEPNEPANRVSAARTAMGLLCRQWIGWPRSYPPMVDGIAYLNEDRHQPQWKAGRRNVFEWYYITQVLHNVGGRDWKRWNTSVREVLIQNQLTTGSVKPGVDIRGSWSPRPEGEGEEYSEKAGRLYLTAMCILILESPYRHRPVYLDEETESQ